MKQSLRKTLTLISIALLVTQLSGCANSPLRNPFKGRAKVTVGPLPEVAQTSDAAVVWKDKDTKGAGDFKKIRPEVTQHAVFQADHLGKIIAYEKTTGSKLWRRDTKLPISSGPVVIGQSIFVGTKDARVVAIDKANGAIQWQAQVSSEVLAPPQGNSTTLLVNTIDGHLAAFDIKTGKKLWTYERSNPALTLRGSAAPVLTDTQVLAGFANGKFVALDLKTGSLIWERTISVPRGRSELHRMVDITSTPIVSRGKVFVATFQGHVVAINLNNGQIEWQRQIASHQDMQMDADALYVTDNDHHVWALDKSTGATLWKQAALEKRIITGPSVTKDYLVVGDYGGYVHWLSKKDGSMKGRRSVGKKVLQSPVSDVGNVTFVTSSNGEMTVLSLEEGV